MDRSLQKGDVVKNLKVLVFAASSAKSSLNRKLAALAAKRLTAAGADVTEIKLDDYQLPIYNADIETKEGVPSPAVALHELFRSNDGIFIASPELNANVSPLLLNVLAWVSRVGENGGMAAAFGQPVFALGSASPGGFGGYRGLMSLRNSLELQLGARVLPAMVSVGAAHEAFDAVGELTNPVASQMLDRLISNFVLAATTK